jgi:hypothetical protein
MGDRYGELSDRMVAVMERLDPTENMERRAERRAEIDELDAGTMATAWLDIDVTVDAYCGERGSRSCRSPSAAPSRRLWCRRSRHRRTRPRAGRR